MTSSTPADRDDVAAGPAASVRPAGVRTASAARPRRKGSTAKLVRRIHVWTSMLSLMVMIFFGLTGILLNHEDWTFGNSASESTASGTVPTSVRTGSTFDTLSLAQYVADREELGGHISGQGVTGTQLWVTYAGPGYQARITADTSTGAYKVTEDRAGLIAVVNDVHRAKNTGTPWRVLNDLAGLLLVVIGITGLLITWLTRARNRRRDLALGVVGLVVLVVVLWTAVA